MDFDLERQKAFVNTMTARTKAEYDKLPLEPTGGEDFYINNGMFGPVCAEFLYAMVRSARPKTVIEVGAGWSSLLIAKALRKNGSGTLTSIDPVAPGFVYNRSDINLKVEPLTSVGPLFSKLEPNDIVLVDGSHTWKQDNDVDLMMRVFMDQIPTGVHVHFHDIWLPEDYPPEFKRRGYDEAEHLEDYLDDHPEWKVNFSTAYMKRNDEIFLSAKFDSYDGSKDPASIWLIKDETKPLKKTTVTGSFNINGGTATNPRKPHKFVSNRNGKKCLVCDFSPEAKRHQV